MEYKTSLQRKARLLVILLLSALSAVSCSGGGGDRGGEKYLTYWSASNQQEIDLARTLVQEWNAANPDFPVRMQPIPAAQSSEEVLLAAIAGKTTPDICSNIWPGVLEQYVEAGAVVKLDSMPGFDSLLTSRIPDGLIDGYRSSDGAFYQIPWKSNPVMFLYNAGYMEALGMDSIPTTYRDFNEIADKVLEVAASEELPLRWMHYRNILPDWWQRLFDFYPFYIAASGGRTLLKDGEVDFDNETAVKVFEFFAEGYRKGYTTRSLVQEDLFVKGKVLADIVGPWRVSNLAKYGPHIRYAYGTLPRPDEVTGPSFTYGDPKSIVIFNTTPYAKKAWEFVKFMLSKESDRRLLDITAQIPVRKGLLEDELFLDYFRENPGLSIFAEQVPYAVGLDKSLNLVEIFDIISQEFDASCIHQSKTPRQGVRDAARRVRNLLMRDRI